MTSKDKGAEDREALERLLDIHGADRTRWPARERLRFAGVISEDKAAARLLAEAEALDRLLDRAPRASEEKLDALKERIVAAALRAQAPVLTGVPGGKADAGKVAAGKTGTGKTGTGKTGTGKTWLGQLRRPAVRFAEWPTAAVLAASLVVGVVLGSAGALDTTVSEVARIAGLSTPADSSQLALSDDVFGQSDEDWL